MEIYSLLLVTLQFLFLFLLQSFLHESAVWTGSKINWFDFANAKSWHSSFGEYFGIFIIDIHHERELQIWKRKICLGDCCIKVLRNNIKNTKIVERSHEYDHGIIIKTYNHHNYCLNQLTIRNPEILNMIHRESPIRKYRKPFVTLDRHLLLF